MRIEMDWQIIDEDPQESWPDEPPPPAPPRRRRLGRKLLFALATIPVLVIAGITVYVVLTYRAQLSRVADPVRSVAQLEAQAVASNDKTSFMALQDPDDSTWRTLQERRFGRLERIGLPELGWAAMGMQPQLGNVSLEPGGARLDMTYQFSVTQPMPGGPVIVTLRVPQFYRLTPTGWVHAAPGTDFWGPQRTLNGKHVTVTFLQRDADVIEPLIPQMDAVLERVCATLACLPRLTVSFENSQDSFGRGGFANGYAGRGSTSRFVSPQLAGLPADARSRGEWYRAIETQMVRSLVASHGTYGQRSAWNTTAFQQILRWYLAQAGLTGPFITPEITEALITVMQAGTWQPLSAISFQSRSMRMNAAQSDVMMPLAVAFLADRLGAGSITQLIPAIGTSPTLGDALNTTLHVNPTTLEPAWRQYLWQQAGWPPLRAESTPPDGKWLAVTQNPSGVTLVTPDLATVRELDRVPNCFNVAWRPNRGG